MNYSLSLQTSSRKRGRDSHLSDEEEEGGEGRVASTGGGIYRANARKQDFKEHGAEYKAKVMHTLRLVVQSVMCVMSCAV